MFTRNYWMYMASQFAGKRNDVYSPTQKPQFISVSGSVAEKDKHSGEYTTYIATESSMTNVKTADVSANVTGTSSGTNIIGHGVVFGSGNVASTIDDYKLSGDVVQNISYSYLDGSEFAEDGSNGFREITYTITNNNDTDITIGEIALFGEGSWKTSSATWSHYFYMFERTALENPITIAPGGVGQVTYTIRMNYPVG